MNLAIIFILTVGAGLCAYAIYVETTKCKMCNMKYGYHKPGCYRNKDKRIRKVFSNHEAWVTCKNCIICFDAREHGYTCPYCHTEN